MGIALPVLSTLPYAQDAHSIIFALLPPLLFESAFNVNYVRTASTIRCPRPIRHEKLSIDDIRCMWTLLIQHVFTKVLKSSMLLASTGVIISTALLGVLFLLFFHEVPASCSLAMLPAAAAAQLLPPTGSLMMTSAATSG